jgi:GT2 family glycosyltransferase/glycosyltransferase involved in cell wall biosynthesis
MYRLGRALAEHADEHPLLLLDRHGAFDGLAGKPGVDVRRAAAGGRVRRFAWEQTRLPDMVRRWDADVLHGPHHALPLLPAAPAAVTTIHDLTFDILPRRYTAARRWYMRAITRLGLLRADRVIVPSTWVRDGLIRRYHLPAARIHVIPEAAAPEMRRVTDGDVLDAVRARYHLPERFILSVGTLEPGKNRVTLLRALAALRRRGLPHALVIAGGQGWGRDDGGWRMANYGPANSTIRHPQSVIRIGYVPDEDLPALYSLADAFVFPSWLEGFGLPPLEAMACGTPVVASTRPAMPEVLGDAALYADPRDAPAWADAIERIVSDPGLSETLARRGTARAAAYSWQRAARETLDVYAAALSGALDLPPQPPSLEGRGNENPRRTPRPLPLREGGWGGRSPGAPTPDLSIVILNYNAAEHVRTCLRSLPAGCAGLATDVVVVDNASPRPGIERVATDFPDVRLIQRRHNGGFAAGVNTGIRAARADAILILNPDTTLAPGAATRMLGYLRAHPGVGVLGPRLLNTDGTLQLSCRRFPSFSTALFNRHSLLTRLWPRNRFSTSYLMSDWDHATTGDVDWLSGAAMLLNRAALDRVGLFDERYFFEIEDVDLCRRMHAAGYHVVYLPDAAVTHHIGASSRTAPVRVILARHAGMWRYYRTYLRGSLLVDALVGAAIAARCVFFLGRESVEWWFSHRGHRAHKGG